jgi:tetratricopeptide (TPR) repeat protein
VTYTNQHRFKEAAEASKKAIRLEPDLAESYYRLGVAYGFLGKHEEAVESFKQAIVLRRDYVEAHMDLAVIYLLLRKRGAALEQYQKVQALNPSLARELFNAIYNDKILTLSPQKE